MNQNNRAGTAGEGLPDASSERASDGSRSSTAPVEEPTSGAPTSGGGEQPEAPDWLIENIAELSKNTRSLYLIYLGALLYCAVTVVGVTDRQMLLNEAVTLPIIGVGVPLTGFFLFAPVVLIATFIYLQLYLQELQGLKRKLRAEYGREKPGRLYPWIMNAIDHPQPGFIGWLQRAAVQLVLWWLLPIVLLLFVLSFLKTQEPTLVGAILCLSLVGLFYTLFMWCKYSQQDKLLFVSIWRDFGKRLMLLGGVAVHLALLITYLHVAVSGMLIDIEVVRGLTTIDVSYQSLVEEQKFAPYWINLRGKKLRGANLESTTLINADLREAEMKGINLSNSQLRGADLEKAQIMSGVLSQVKLDSANLRDVVLINSNLYNSTAVNSVFDFSSLDSSDFRGSRLDCSRFVQATLNDADLSRANLIGANLKDVKALGATLSHAVADGADLTRADLDTSILNGIYLRRANLFGAYFRDSDLRGARLDGADVSVAHMEDADLSGAFLRGTTLISTHLERATLFYARLDSADLSYAHLQGTSLVCATLRHVDIDNAEVNAGQLCQAATLEGLKADSVVIREIESQCPARLLDPSEDESLADRCPDFEIDATD